MYHQQQQQGRLLPNANNVPSSGYGKQPTSYKGQNSSVPAFTTQSTPQPATKVYEYQNQQQRTTITKKPDPVIVKPEDDIGDVSMEPSGKRLKKKKVPGLIKRRWQNARLRKRLRPRNAIMVLNEIIKLNEVKASVKFTCHEQATALAPTSFLVNAEVDGKNFIGQGLSKQLAKQNAAENALKALLLEKLAAAAQGSTIDSTIDSPMDTDDGSGTTPAVAADNVDAAGDDDNNKPGAPEDEVPWSSLASFALFKLFTDWQNQGTHVPLPKTAVAAKALKTAVPAKPLKLVPMKQLPDNPTDRHPVMLLSQMRPGCKFVEQSREGTAPNLTFTQVVTVDGVSYTGVAKNKKDAKKEAAKAALLGCLNIQYE